MLINVKFYSPPGLKRSLAARSHIERYYDDYADLAQNPPDGLIVTGTEPIAAALEDEPCWQPIATLVDWAIDCGIPGIWSCLASHVAVRHLDGIDRHRQPRKISGLFDCRISRSGYQITHGLPDVWRVPHSRLNGLSERALRSHGYAILSRSPEIGVDMFSRKQGALQLFFQGHPEYDADSLLGEYKRDVRRFLSGATEAMPQVPKGYFDARTSNRTEPGVAPGAARECRATNGDSRCRVDRPIAGKCMARPGHVSLSELAFIPCQPQGGCSKMRIRTGRPWPVARRNLVRQRIVLMRFTHWYFYCVNVLLHQR